MGEFFRKFKDHFVPSERNVYRPHLLRKPWLVFFVAMALTAQSIFIFDILARQSAFDFIAAVLPGQVIAFTNDQRIANNVGALTESATLNAAAAAKAADMAAKGYFAHVSPDGTEPWEWVKASGYEYQYAGENLAVRFTDSSEVVHAWMASPTHRANIVKPAYTDIGVGVAEGVFQGQPATFVVQYFAAPRTVAVAASVPQVATPTGASATTSVGAAISQVAGAEVAAPPTNGDVEGEVVLSDQEEVAIVSHEPAPWSAIAKNLITNENSPSAMSLWVLGGIASLLVIALAFTFFVHIQIQPTDMLIGGTVVAVMALAFLALNMQATGLSNNTQTAAVFGAVPVPGGFIDSGAATFVER